MTGINFKINNKVEVISEDEVYSCDIQDVKDDYIAISMPIKDSQYLPLRKGERVEVLYYEGSCIYKFSSSVVSREKSNIPLVWINQPINFKKIQRRKYVRISLLLDVRYAVVNRDFKLNKSSLASIKFEKGTLLDLSGGGTKLKTIQEIKKDDIIAIILPVEEGSILVKTEIKRLSKDELGNAICGLSFIDLKIMEQEKIIKFVFSIMRDQMKKGLKEE